MENLNEKGVIGAYAPRWIKMYEDYKKDPEKDTLFFKAPVLLVVTALSPLNGGWHHLILNLWQMQRA